MAKEGAMLSNNPIIPCCYFPMTVVLLDDDQQMVDHWGIRVQEMGFPCEGFTSPYKAKDYILAQGDFSVRNHTLVSAGLDPNETNSVIYGMDVELSSLTQLVYDKDRYHSVGSLIVDYAMPVMTGLEFSRDLARPRVQKILLTGKADENLAVKAFNDGLIKKFVMKNDPTLEKTLYESLFDLQFDYFTRQSEFIYNVYDNALNEKSYLQDPELVAWFKDYFHQHHIREFYLISDGSYIDFLMLDHAGKSRWLALRSQAELDEIAELSALDTVRAYRQCPLIKSRQELLAGAEAWQHLLVDIKPIPGVAQPVYFAEQFDCFPACIDQRKITFRRT